MIAQLSRRQRRPPRRSRRGLSPSAPMFGVFEQTIQLHPSPLQTVLSRGFLPRGFPGSRYPRLSLLLASENARNSAGQRRALSARIPRLHRGPGSVRYWNAMPTRPCFPHSLHLTSTVSFTAIAPPRCHDIQFIAERAAAAWRG